MTCPNSPTSTNAGKLNLDELVVRHYTLDQINEAYDDMDKGEIGRGVIVF